MKAKVDSVGLSGDGDPIFDLEGNVGAEMVPQVLPHARQLVDLGYSELLKLLL